MKPKTPEYPRVLWLPVHPVTYDGAAVCGDGDLTIVEPDEKEIPCGNGAQYVRYIRADLVSK